MSIIIKAALCLSIIFLTGLSAKSQDHQWWSTNVGWDGSSHWREYLIYAPRFLGANALPIPPMDWGQIEDEHVVGTSAHVHWMEGDRTINPKIYGRYIALAGKIAFEATYIPVEFFRTSHQWKTDRNVFHLFYHDRVASGDVIFRTRYQLLTESDRRVGVTARFGFRVPASNKVGAARFTDAPGYYLDVTGGKSFMVGKVIIRYSAMAGFLVWQNNTQVNLQNDAILFGMGIRLTQSDWSLESVFRGYLGYLDNGDRPLALSFRMNRTGQKLEGYLGYQMGLGDLLYHQVQVGVGFRM